MCGPGFVGRAAEPSDQAGVAAVAAEAGVAAPDRPALDAARAGRGQFDVAVSAGEVIGFCATGEAGSDGVALLVGPAVRAAWAGLGVERALLARALEGATARGVRALRAHVPAGDPARLAWFTGQGFVRAPDHPEAPAASPGLPAGRPGPRSDAGGRLALTRTL